MLPTSKAHLWDVREACRAALSFVDGMDEEDFQASVLHQSAVERQLLILGEALNRLRKTDAETSSEIADLDRIIGMRNILAHEYGVVDCIIVWSVLKNHLPQLSLALTDLLRPIGEGIE